MTSLFKTPSAPTVQTPPTMPDPYSASIQEAKRTQAAAMMAAGGRSSTILTTAANRAQTGGDYSAKTLGG